MRTVSGYGCVVTSKHVLQWRTTQELWFVVAFELRSRNRRVNSEFIFRGYFPIIWGAKMSFFFFFTCIR